MLHAIIFAIEVVSAVVQVLVEVGQRVIRSVR